MSVFPGQLDTDLEIPRVEGNVTEIGGDAINSLRDAVFNIERSLGVSLQGNKASLDDRISVSIDTNGNLKASAVQKVGLVTLPITNAQVSAKAAIEEIKLDLDFSTQSLKTLLDSIRIDTTQVQINSNRNTILITDHNAGLTPRHDGYHININTGTFVGVRGLVATTIGAAVNEISNVVFTHINTSLAAGIDHTADTISVNTSNFTIMDTTSETAQDALDDINIVIPRQINIHTDNLHSNGILKDINSGEFFNANQKKISSTIASYVLSDTRIRIPGLASFASLINPGDIIDIESTVADIGTYRIERVGPATPSETLGDFIALTSEQVSVFHMFQSTESAVSISVYKASSVSSESAPLACAVRHHETQVDSITVLNPDAARVVSLGFNGEILSVDGYSINVEVGLGHGNVRGLTIPSLHLSRLTASLADPVDSESVAERINAYVSDTTTDVHFPISAFRIGNELAIAHNLVGPEYTLKILDGYTGNFALGLDSYGADILDQTIAGNSSNLYNVNGIPKSGIRTILDGTATLAAVGSVLPIFDNSGNSVNPFNIGIDRGSVLHITNHSQLNANGSYTVTGISLTEISLAPATVPAGTFDILVTDSHISLLKLATGETDHGLIEVFVDENERILISQRLMYGNDLGAAVDVINLSNGFPVGTVIINQVDSGSDNSRTFNIIADSVSGDLVTVDKDFLGTFNLYHTNNIDFLTIRINSEIIGSKTASVIVDETLNADETLHISTLHFDSVDTINSIADKRQFGNLGANQIRDDFIELFSQRPVSDLRSNGVVRGFDTLAMPYVDVTTNMQALPINGGVAYVDGVRLTVETQKVIIRSFDVNSVVVGNVQKTIGINNFGTIKAFDETVGEMLTDGYESSTQFGKILPLYTVTLDSDGLIDQITDLRLFINNIDEKLEIIVDETNNVVGNFRTLDGALIYAESYPGSEKLTINILGTVNITKAISVPQNISLVGRSIYGGNDKIVNSLDLNNNLITLSGNNTVKNLKIESTLRGMDGALVFVNGANVNIEKCSLTFTDPTVSSFTESGDIGVELGTGASSNVRIINNRINTVFAGISSLWGCNDLIIENNNIKNILGASAEAQGIYIASNTRGITNTVIRGNLIEVPTVTTSTIIGIKIDVNQEIELLRIENNSIIHRNGDTMTDGIRVINSSSSGNVIVDLFVINNFIRGISLNANGIFGMYISNCTRAKIHGNTLNDIGASVVPLVGNTNTGDAFLRIADGVAYSEVVNNILQDGNVLSGIEVTDSNPVFISDNTLIDVGTKDNGSDQVAGTSTVYIRGNTVRSMIHSNTLNAAAGLYGIRWALAGTQTKISDNHIDGPFSEYAVLSIGEGNSVTNNTIINMSAGSIGIASESPTGLAKIIGNTVDGTNMNALISAGLSGDSSSNNVISSNKLKNTANTTSTFIRLLDITDSLVMGNHMEGAASNGISGDTFAGGADTALIDTTISNNIIVGTVTRPLDLGASLTAGCFVSGNFFPDINSPDISNGVLGPVPVLATINKNLVGVNRGLVNSIGLALPEGTSSSRDSDGYLHWQIDDTGDFWRANSAVTGDRSLYFSLNKVPNGTRLSSVDVTGWMASSSNDTLSAEVFRKSVKIADNLISDTITTGGTAVSIGSSGFFSSAVSVDSTSDEDVVNYAQSNYYIVITSNSGTITSAIHGLTLNFKY